MHQGAHLYMMASQRNGTLYLGVTGDLLRRVGQHRAGEVESFTKRYNVKMLVWHDHFQDVRAAIARETQMKGWKRAWKVRVIEERNPRWEDLALAMGFDPLPAKVD